MVTLIKNQILKHLSRFTKNLSPDKINLSTFKGEGELSNLELDENVLTELLELPSWLRLTSAWCNRACFRIQWTRLKTVPIYLRLDEVQVVVETCEQLRSTSTNQGLSSLAAPGAKYSFINKVIDGMTVSVNAVMVTFKSPAFVASVQVSRIVVESKSPTWKRCDLRMTRLKNAERGELLLFKELEWQTVRIEARSTLDPELTPLRLLTNQARCRITIKKRLSDCFVMGSRLVLILDDLLWVLTDSQLRAALHFVDSLAGLVQQATEETRKRKAARKIEVLPEYQAWVSQQARQSDTQKSAISHMFSRCDVVETSYHFLSEQIDLHLCDDVGDGRSSHPDLKDGGAFQIRLRHFKIDYYPYHLALGDRRHWPSYQEDVHCQWLEQALSAFRARFLELIDAGAKAHAPLSRAAPGAGGEAGVGEEKLQAPGVSPGGADKDGRKSSGSSSPGGNPVKTHVLRQLAKLMTSCVILRLEDFTLYRVTTSQRKQAPKEFIAGDKDRYSLPQETSVVHAEFTYFYYPGDTPFPLPPPQFYVHLNPIQINFDVLTLLWLQAFGLHLHRSLAAASPSQPSLTYVDVKIEAIMPRVIIEACGSEDAAAPHHSQRDRPKCLQFMTSRALITNVRTLTSGSRADLAACLNDLQQGELFFGSGFPSKLEDQHAVIDKFLSHVSASDNLRSSPELSSSSVNELIKGLSRELLWIEAKDVWFIQLEPVWGEFTGARASPGRPVPFLDAFPLTLWVYMKKLSQPPSKNMLNNETVEDKLSDIHALAHIPSLVSIQINHYQFLFVSRLLEEVTELTSFLTIDSQHIMHDDGGSVCMGIALPQLEVTFVMPAQCQGKESSGGDLESVLPDSSSLADVQNAFLEPNSTTQVTSITPFNKELELRRSDTGTPISDLASPLSSNELPFPPEPIDSVNYNMSHSFTAGTPVQTNTNTPFKIPNNLNLSSMKKGLASGFTNLMTSFDSALKASPDDASDSMSVRSDGSSDSERFIVVNLEQERTDMLDAVFLLPNSANRPVEEASEVVEEDETPSEHSEVSLFRRRDMVSVCTIKLSRVEVIQHSHGFCSSIRVQCSGVSAEECGCIPWDEFQGKFSSRARAWCEDSSESARCSIRLRLDRAPDHPPPGLLSDGIPVRRSLSQLFTDTLEAQAINMRLSLSLSSLAGLADLLEDEILPKPVPMQVLLENIDLHLSEDRSAVSQLSASNPVPLDVCISRLRVARTASGTFHIEPAGPGLIPTSLSNVPSNNSGAMLEVELARRRAAELARENEELRRRLLALERAKVHEEQILKARINELQGDRLALQATLRQQQMAQQAAIAAVNPPSPRSSRQSSTRR